MISIKRILLYLAIIGLIVSIAISNVSAAEIHVDADWRLITNFKITDVSTGENIYSADVSAGAGHYENIDMNTHKYIKLL